MVHDMRISELARLIATPLPVIRNVLAVVAGTIQVEAVLWL
jgi:hypothetical protein